MRGYPVYKFIPVLAVAIAMSACAPVQIQKCQKDYMYDVSGKVSREYSECITQPGGQVPMVHLKDDELLK